MSAPTGGRAAAAASFPTVPVNRFFGFRIVELTEGRAVVAMPMRGEYVQEYGVVQGGVLTALADAAAAYVVQPVALERGETLAGIDAHMRFLSPALVGGGELIAVAEALRFGKRIVVCRSEIRQDDRLVAVGTFAFSRGKNGSDEGT